MSAWRNHASVILAPSKLGVCKRACERSRSSRRAPERRWAFLIRHLPPPSRSWDPIASHVPGQEKFWPRLRLDRSHPVVAGVVGDLGQPEPLQEWWHVHGEAASVPFAQPVPASDRVIG